MHIDLNYKANHIKNTNATNKRFFNLNKTIITPNIFKANQLFRSFYNIHSKIRTHEIQRIINLSLHQSKSVITAYSKFYVVN